MSEPQEEPAASNGNPEQETHPPQGDSAHADTSAPQEWVAVTKDIVNYDAMFRTSQPEVKLRRIRRFNTYEVLDSDLDDLDLASQEEKHSLAFASLSLGGLISTVASWIGSSVDDPKAIAVYVAATLVLLIAGVYFATTWARQRRKHQDLLQRIKTQTATFEETTVPQ